MDFLLYLLLILLSYIGVGLYRRYAILRGVLDHPNHRSSHESPTPRGGGLIIAVIWLLLVFATYYFHELDKQQFSFFVFPCLIVTFIAFLEDRYHATIKLRFFSHLIASILALYFLKGLPILYMSAHWSLQLGLLGSVLAVLACVWSLNLYNFMDGLDGYSSVEAIFIFGVGGLLYLKSPDFHRLTFLMWSIVALVLGFLIWNWPKAKIFMGDVGSSFLGVAFLLFALYGSKHATIPLMLWLYLYGLFGFDATVTLVRRILHGDSWYQSHKLHAYQRLHQSGFTHLQVLFSNIILNSIIAVLVLATVHYNLNLFLIGMIELAILITYYLWVEKRRPMYGV